MTAKKRDFFVYNNCVGRVISVGVTYIGISWLYNPHRLYQSHQSREALGLLEVIPKDVAYNLVEVLERNGS